METPEKVSKNTKANITSTPNWDGLQDEIERDKTKDKNLKAPSSATSYGFLLVALLFYLTSIFTCAYLAIAKFDNKVKITWGLLFLPLWLSNGIIIFCHLGAIVFAGLLIANVKARYTNEHQPITVKNAKQIFYWITCEPFFGVLPSLFSLIFIIWLEVNLFHWVNNAKIRYHYSMLLPLYILFALSILRDIFGGDGSNLSMILVVCLTVFFVLGPSKAEGNFFKTVSWQWVFTPLIIVLCSFILQTLWILYNDMKWQNGGGVCAFKSKIQRFGVFLYLVGGIVTLVGVINVMQKLTTPSTPTIFVPGQVGNGIVSIFIGIGIIFFALYVLACNFAMVLKSTPDDVMRVHKKSNEDTDKDMMRRKSKSSLNFNDHETGHGGAEKNPLLDGSGNANNNKDTNNDNKNATIEGEADWIFYGRMKIIHQKNRGTDYDEKDTRGCLCINKCLDKYLDV